MSEIKEILDEIANESSTLKKTSILKEHNDNELLKRVLYLGNSKRVKFFIKQIPEYPTPRGEMGLDVALDSLSELTERKVTGHSAIGFLVHLLSSVSIGDAEVLEKVIKKDLKINFGTTNINKVIPNLIEKTPYMGATPFAKELVMDLLKSGNPVYSQLKMDGRYTNAIVRSGEGELESRDGNVTHVGNAKFLNEINSLPDGVYNGELTVEGYDRYTANGMIASIVDIESKREIRTASETEKKIANFEKKHANYQESLDRIIFTIWDVITVDEYFKKSSKTPYTDRLQKVINLLDTGKFNQIKLIELTLITSFGEAMTHFKSMLDRGLEGTILKDSRGLWKNGKPKWQVKMKLEMTLDLRAIGFNYGTPGTKNENLISTIQMESECGLLKTNPSGMDEEMMQYVTENQESLLGTIFEIRCCGLSQNREGNYSTLHPSVVKLRDDKDVADTLESAKRIEEMQKNLS